jgi:hypothetical protein
MDKGPGPGTSVIPRLPAQVKTGGATAYDFRCAIKDMCTRAEPGHDGFVAMRPA